MGAVEHLKTLCCLGLAPESAMIAVTPLLHSSCYSAGVPVDQVATWPTASHNPGHEADVVQTEVERALLMRLQEEV
jgi:hypothetical protein